MYGVLSNPDPFHSIFFFSRLERYPGHSSTTTSTRMRASVDQGDPLSHDT